MSTNGRSGGVTRSTKNQNEKRCSTAFLDEATTKDRFLTTANILLAGRPDAIRTCEATIKTVFDLTDLLAEQARLHGEMTLLSGMMEESIREKEDVSTPIVKTPKEPALIPCGYASAEAVAYIAAQKFVIYVPLYRQELDWNRRGIQITRQTFQLVDSVRRGLVFTCL